MLKKYTQGMPIVHSCCSNAAQELHYYHSLSFAGPRREGFGNKRVSDGPQLETENKMQILAMNTNFSYYASFSPFYISRNKI